MLLKNQETVGRGSLRLEKVEVKMPRGHKLSHKKKLICMNWAINLSHFTTSTYLGYIQYVCMLWNERMLKFMVILACHHWVRVFL